MGSLVDLAAQLTAAAHRIEEENRPLHKASELLVSEIKSAIGTYRYGWPALADSTVARKGADTPLLETGGYQASFTFVLGRHEAWIGTVDPKVIWFENGTSRMPPRPVLLPALIAKAPEIAAEFKDVLLRAVIYNR